MRILSISAQKPGSTGSGVFLVELVRSLGKKGHVQAVAAGVYADDPSEWEKDVRFYPVYFQEHPEIREDQDIQGHPDIPYPIAGMSDEMPYRSTRYCDFTPRMTEQFREGFLCVIDRAIKEFQPDLILCHHLYLLTAIVREAYPKHRIFGFCHNTDLRQMEKNPLERGFMKRMIPKLDRVFALHDAQKERIEKMFSIPGEKIRVTGMGYNSEIFRKLPEETEHTKHRGQGKRAGVPAKLIYAGKIAEKKGVVSLMRALRLLPFEAGALEVYLAGGAGNRQEYEAIRGLAEKSPYPVHFLGKLSQQELAGYYRHCQVFVLPSFYEGLPLTVIEALACGCRVVMTDLPGIRDWILAHAPGADIVYVEPPQIAHTDEAAAESLPAFERRLAEAVAESVRKKETRPVDTSRISWDGLADQVLDGIAFLS